jgi:hypothetical protein
MGRPCRRNAKPAQSPPRNTASPSGPSARQTTLSATAETAACGVPRTVSFGNEGLQGSCCDRVWGQRETPWPIFQWHRNPFGQSLLWQLMWVHKQKGWPPVSRTSPPTTSLSCPPLGVRGFRRLPLGLARRRSGPPSSPTKPAVSRVSPLLIQPSAVSVGRRVAAAMVGPCLALRIEIHGKSLATVDGFHPGLSGPTEAQTCRVGLLPRLRASRRFDQAKSPFSIGRRDYFGSRKSPEKHGRELPTRRRSRRLGSRGRSPTSGLLRTKARNVSRAGAGKTEWHLDIGWTQDPIGTQTGCSIEHEGDPLPVGVQTHTGMEPETAPPHQARCLPAPGELQDRTVVANISALIHVSPSFDGGNFLTSSVKPLAP